MTEKQQRFIEEYLKCLDGTEAARRAEYSVKCAHQQAYENLRKPHIRRIINKIERLWEKSWYARYGRI